jgi:hypothetical protein
MVAAILATIARINQIQLDHYRRAIKRPFSQWVLQIPVQSRRNKVPASLPARFENFILSQNQTYPSLGKAKIINSSNPSSLVDTKQSAGIN